MFQKKLLIVTDPLCMNSVQLNLLNRIINDLGSYFKITVYSTYIEPKARENVAGPAKISKTFHSFVAYRLYRSVYGENESILWFFSWLRETLFKLNSRNYVKEINPIHYDVVINIAQTIQAVSDIHWGQSIPLDMTLSSMGGHGFLRFITSFVLTKIGRMDRSLIRNVCSKADVVVVNSRYTKDVYEKIGIRIKHVIYSAPDLMQFMPKRNGNSRKYILAYIGKETEIDTILAIARKGVDIVAFGGKIPLGVNIAELNSMTDFRGSVSREELIKLYSNALFTVFPFTYEPFGSIPLESISCGTPILTYGKQGPLETVRDGITGWLVNDSEELIGLAVKLWHLEKLKITEIEQERARFFSIFNSDTQLKMLVSNQYSDNDTKESVTVERFIKTNR